MSGYADRLTAIGVQHGTLAGFDAGCRAELSCPARHAGRASCLAVRIRYCGDWAYRRLVDAGVPEHDAGLQVDEADRAAQAAAYPTTLPATRHAQRRSRVPAGDRVRSGGARRSGARTAARTAWFARWLP